MEVLAATILLLESSLGECNALCNHDEVAENVFEMEVSDELCQFCLSSHEDGKCQLDPSCC